MSLASVNVSMLAFAAAFGLILMFAPGPPPTHITFESYTIDPPMKAKRKLAPNFILNDAKLVKLDRKISGPDSVALRGNELYFGDNRGMIRKIKNGKISTVLKLKFPCYEVARYECSWPLGMRFAAADEKLVFVDAYGGLLRVDVDTGALEHLLARGEYVEGAPIGFPNDLDVGKDGAIYFSDSTTTSTIETINQEINGHPSGRLLKFDPSVNETTVLISNIHFANGVQLSLNEDFVLVVDVLGYRIWRYYLNGEKKGQKDVFLRGLPGLADNIRSNGKGGFYLSLSSPRPSSNLAPYPNVRRFLTRAEYLINSITSTLHMCLPCGITRYIYNYGRSWFEVQNESKNALILELNQKGKIIGSLQSTNGALHGISQIIVGPKYSYLVSPIDSNIWFVNTADL